MFPLLANLTRVAIIEIEPPLTMINLLRRRRIVATNVTTACDNYYDECIIIDKLNVEVIGWFFIWYRHRDTSCAESL